MLKRLTALIALIAFSCEPVFAEVDKNWTGWRDTSAITGLDSIEILYSKYFPLSAYENSLAILKIDDTAATGFADDSIQVEWGYQTATLTLDTGGSADTLPGVLIVLDTLKDDSLGKAPEGVVTSNMATLTMPNGQVDTTSVTGFAAQYRWFVPEWAPFVRFWVRGQTGNNASDSLKVQFDYQRRVKTKSGL